MDITALLALIISGLVFLYTIFKDNTKESNQLKGKVAELSTAITVHQTLIDRLESEQIGLQKRMENLESKLNDVDKNVVQIKTTLDSILKILDKLDK